MDKPRYKSRDGEVLTREQWKEAREREEVRIVRTFRNDKVYLLLEWNGCPSNYAAPFELWDVYELTVWNWLIDGAELEGGRWVIDPASRTYWDEAHAVTAYEQFLAKYTDCERSENEDGTVTFTEVGNELTPPDPNTPSGADNNPFIGSW